MQKPFRTLKHAIWLKTTQIDMYCSIFHKKFFSYQYLILSPTYGYLDSSTSISVKI